jgi:hypothetical protein
MPHRWHNFTFFHKGDFAMSELDDVISESLEHAAESRLNSYIAICVAVTATFMALCNIKGGNIVQNMSKAQSKAVNDWTYFQSKSTKQNVVENTIDLLTSQKEASESESVRAEIQKKIDKLKEKFDRYEKEKNEIKLSAESQEKSYDDMNVFDDQFDLTEATLSIAIALFGVTALTQKKPLFFFALILSLMGSILGLVGFMGISIHFNFISNILG